MTLFALLFLYQVVATTDRWIFLLYLSIFVSMDVLVKPVSQNSSCVNDLCFNEYA